MLGVSGPKLAMLAACCASVGLSSWWPVAPLLAYVLTSPRKQGPFSVVLWGKGDPEGSFWMQGGCRASLAEKKKRSLFLRLLHSFFHPFSFKKGAQPCCSTWASLLSFFPAPLLHSIPPTSTPPPCQPPPPPSCPSLSFPFLSTFSFIIVTLILMIQFCNKFIELLLDSCYIKIIINMASSKHHYMFCFDLGHLREKSQKPAEQDSCWQQSFGELKCSAFGLLCEHWQTFAD